MLQALAAADTALSPGSLLDQICELGLRYARKTMSEKVSPRLLGQISQHAMKSLENSLGRVLAEAVAQCLELHLNACRSAASALAVVSGTGFSGKAGHNQGPVGLPPRDLLLQLFEEFPALGGLWCDLISAWNNRVANFLSRLQVDRAVLGKFFFRGRRPGKVLQLQADLSDPHNRGQRVIGIEFEAGSVIYKPRGGDGEWEWFEILDWMNENGFAPKFLTLQVLRRKGYCWMERVAPASCDSTASVRRFYERTGGLLCVAYLLQTVDCHCENMIAAGEHPVLVDSETLWHTNEKFSYDNGKGILRTGFLPLPNDHPDSEYPCSPLGKIDPGPYTPRLKGKFLEAAKYEAEIEKGFCLAWSWLLKNRRRRAVLLNRIKRIARQHRRWIYWPTLSYIFIRDASLSPPALRSPSRRSLLIKRWCRRKDVPASVVKEEVEAIARLDIPHFVRRPSAGVYLPDPSILPEAVQFVRTALGS